MTPNDLRVIVAEELSNVDPDADLSRLNPDADLREALDIDSMDHLNFVTALCRRLQVAIPEVDYPKLTTLNGAVAYLLAKTAARTASGTGR
ncbi:acyl carrier protein [Azospirillum formosense]|uniref:acyl carrier protein n=1 Tax=Azospirillum formosense TaxID=861533 RepID=UPI001C92B410|nr:acyl carrier protein [Azospirillum formosense]MBY3757042.1 acyl carrier protein [Azospirillum formosense]